jgi:hypothetical protein
MSRTDLSRRHFLRAAGTLIALPALSSLGFKAFAAEKPVTQPKRMVFLGFGYGVTNETWFPSLKDTGADYALPAGLVPLAEHKKDFTLVQGLSNKFSDEAHWGSTFWLTGANRYSEPGQSFHNGISADQVAARELGKEHTLHGSHPTRMAAIPARVPATAPASRWHGMPAASQSDRPQRIPSSPFTASFPMRLCRSPNAKPCSPSKAACSTP